MLESGKYVLVYYISYIYLWLLLVSIIFQCENIRGIPLDLCLILLAFSHLTHRFSQLDRVLSMNASRNFRPKGALHHSSI